jgi:hypothetical protein
MRLSVRRAVELALGTAAAALAVLLAVPWETASQPRIAAAASLPPTQQGDARPVPEAAVLPEAVVRLFTGVPAAAAPAAPPPSPRPIDAPWLRYVGRSSAPDGTTHVYVKDTKSERVIRATRGEVLDGWMLVAEDASSLTLRHGDELYAVAKR